MRNKSFIGLMVSMWCFIALFLPLMSITGSASDFKFLVVDTSPWMSGLLLFLIVGQVLICIAGQKLDRLIPFAFIFILLFLMLLNQQTLPDTNGLSIKTPMRFLDIGGYILLFGAITNITLGLSDHFKSNFVGINNYDKA